MKILALTKGIWSSGGLKGRGDNFHALILENPSFGPVPNIHPKTSLASSAKPRLALSYLIPLQCKSQVPTLSLVPLSLASSTPPSPPSPAPLCGHSFRPALLSQALRCRHPSRLSSVPLPIFIFHSALSWVISSNSITRASVFLTKGFNQQIIKSIQWFAPRILKKNYCSKIYIT